MASLQQKSHLPSLVSLDAAQDRATVEPSQYQGRALGRRGEGQWVKLALHFPSCLHKNINKEFLKDIKEKGFSLVVALHHSDSESLKSA